MQQLASEIIIKSVAVTGVQPKLSLSIEKVSNDPKKSRFTIVGLWGDYILKPPTKEFPHLPENEDLSMHLCEEFGIATASHSLIRLRSGELAYITKRFDRNKNIRLALEDMCQLTETLTEDKYRSSMENIGKQIAKFSSRPGLDVITFFETSLFCFLIGNADMHLKNFALLTTKAGDVILSPAFDMVSTALAMPEDKDEMALTLNAKKRKIKRKDFDALATHLKIPERSRQIVYERSVEKLKAAEDWIKISILPEKMKSKYLNILRENAGKLSL